jgi:hypothetical protein
LNWGVPADWTLKKEGEESFLEDATGARYTVDDDTIYQKLRETGLLVNFNVQYVGQSYGDEGSRTAIERLKKHETLQKIALEGIPQGFKPYVLLLEPVAANRIITVFNPKAENKEDSDKRIDAGLDKLFGTTEKERISLYEASMIRYFKPKYNIKFKDSFPSTNMALLKECYDKDFAMIIAELGFDVLPFQLFSDSAKATDHHIAKHDLHSDDSRKLFFSDKLKA